MTDTGFTPYWKTLSEEYGPDSWLFCVTAKIHGRHRTLAAVSSTGTAEEVESLVGPRLVACCRRIATIFSDPANHTAIRGEIALAARHYGAEYEEVQPVELPELNRRQPYGQQWHREWDRENAPPFPFTTAALLQGVGFDLMWGPSAPTRPEPLSTVWRGDTDIEWGLVVFDVTHLSTASVETCRIPYGIVGFRVGMAKYIATKRDEVIPFLGACFEGEQGPLRVVEKERARKVLTAAEYMAKFDYIENVLNRYEYDTLRYHDDMDFLSSLPSVEDTVLNLLWPRIETPVDDPVIDEPQERSEGQIVDSTGNAIEVGRLLRTKWLRDGHLGLECLVGLTVEALSAALDDDSVLSLGLCIDGIRATPDQLADGLSGARHSLREICLHQSLALADVTLSLRIFIALSAIPQFLTRVNVTFSSAYSAALRKKSWLPSSPNLVPLATFPVQQIFIKHTRPSWDSTRIRYDHVYLEEGLLKPQHFAAGFLLWISTLKWSGEFDFDGTSPTFAFSSGPATLAENPASAAQVSPPLCEDLALIQASRETTQGCPRARDLDPRGWSVVVSQEGSQPTRYAFVRALKETIAVNRPHGGPLGPQELGVFSLRRFLADTTSNTNIDISVPLQDTLDSLCLMSWEETTMVLAEFL